MILYRSQHHRLRLRRDVIFRCVQNRQWRLAVCVLFLPPGWEMTQRTEITLSASPETDEA